MRVSILFSIVAIGRQGGASHSDGLCFRFEPHPTSKYRAGKNPRVFWLNRLCHRARAKNVRIEAFQGKKAAKGHMIPETQPRLKSEKKLVVVLPNFRLFLVEKTVGAPLIITWCPDEILFVKPAEFTASCLFSPCLLF